MNRPPPHGWHRQPPGWPQPRKRSKAPVVIVLVVLLLMLAGLGTAAFLYFDVRQDQGQPPRSGVPNEKLCDAVSGATLAKIRTTNPDNIGQYTTEYMDVKTTTCAWSQTKGQDGEGLRTTKVVVKQGKVTNEQPPSFRQYDTDQTAYATYVARTDATLVLVEYGGWDPGLLFRAKPPTQELEATAKLVAEEVLEKL